MLGALFMEVVGMFKLIDLEKQIECSRCDNQAIKRIIVSTSEEKPPIIDEALCVDCFEFIRKAVVDSNK